MRKIKFQNENYYHIYNRGVDKRDVFKDKYDYIRFLESIRLFNSVENIRSIYEYNYFKKQFNKELNSQLGVKLQNKSLVEIVCYSLNPNHFHILAKQKEEKGVTRFMQKICSGYTNYFNKKYNRIGSLFQGTFKCVGIKTDSYLIYLSSYINANSEIHKIAKANKWPWSSYLDYLGKREGTLCNKEPILNQLKNLEEYQKLTQEIINNSINIKEEIKKYLLDE
jgi:putative transposase